MKPGTIPILSKSEKEVMLTLLNDPNLKHKFAIRVQAVLGRAEKKRTNDIANLLHVHPVTISQWVNAYKENGIESLLSDKSRPPRKKPISPEKEKELCRIVCTEKPKNATHWSTRSLSERVGLSHTAVHKILKKYNLKPHQIKSFKISKDPNFEEKLEDIIGLYLNPPKKSIIFCIDEKSQIQALQRTQPTLPLKPNRPITQTHDYLRHGVTTLFAALNVATGNVIGKCMKKHRSTEYLKFLKIVEKKAPKHYTLHIIVDNYSTHKTKEVQEYIKKSKRFVVHFTPTGSSWLNQVERWFAEITNKRIRRQSWNSVKELTNEIMRYIDDWNQNSQPFVWTKSANEIKEKVNRAKKSIKF